MPTNRIPWSVLSAAFVNAAGDTMTGALTLPNTGLHLLDTDASHDLIIAPGSNLTADKTLTITTGDSDRTITLSGNPTLNDWFDQAVKQASSPTLAGLTLTGFSGYVKAATGVLSAGAIADGDLPATIKGLTLAPQAVGFTIAGGTTSKTLTVPLDASVSGSNTGDQTITLTSDVTGSGTGSFATTIANNAVTFAKMQQVATGVLLGRNTALTGNIEAVTDIATAITIGGAYIYRAGGTDVAVADGGTNLSSYAVGDILYASGTTTLAKLADVATGSVLVSGGVNTAPAYSAAPSLTTSITAPLVYATATSASPIVYITNQSDTNTYDPQIAFRTGATPATRFTIWLDDSDSDMLKFSPTTSTTYPPLILGTTGKSVINILDNDTEALVIAEALNKYLTFDTTNTTEKIVAGKDLEIGLVEFDANSGAVLGFNMNITGTDAAGTPQSISTGLDGTSILTVYGEADGAGALQNPRVGVNTVTPTVDFDVAGSVKLGSASTDIVTMTGRMVVRTLASDPQDGTPANRPAGSLGEIGFYNNKWYGCVSAATPTWELFTSV